MLNLHVNSIRQPIVLIQHEASYAPNCQVYTLTSEKKNICTGKPHFIYH